MAKMGDVQLEFIQPDGGESLHKEYLDQKYENIQHVILAIGDLGQRMGVTEMDNIKIIKYDSKYADDIVRMWRQSKEKAIGQKEAHSFEEHVSFLNHILNEDNKIYIAVDIDNNKVVGIVAFNENEINQLYVHTDYQGKGIGEKLVNLAKTSAIVPAEARFFQSSTKYPFISWRSVFLFPTVIAVLQLDWTRILSARAK